MDPPLMSLEKKIKEEARGRQKFAHEGRLIYEWEQSLDEVHMFVPLPSKDIKKNNLNIVIAPKRISVGLKDNRFYIDEELWGTIDTTESIWYIECCKMKKGETWHALFLGHGELNPFAQQEVQKKLMLERFQQEHPGFDFSNAEFSGTAPDPRTFMGGVSYK